MQKIRCVVERVTYQNPENGYSVLKCRVKRFRRKKKRESAKNSERDLELIFYQPRVYIQ